MKKRKQQIVGKSKYYQRQRPIPADIHDLSTHEEQEMYEIDHECQSRQQQLFPIKERQSSEDEGEAQNGPDPNEQSLFVLGLIQKNKLNEKNSFEVPLIDLRDLKSFKLTEEGEAWKEISASLDANSKVYGFRVDQVHHSTFKMLAGLNRSKKEDPLEQQKLIAEEEEIVKRKQIKNTNGESTLEKNPSNIELIKIDEDFQVDPLFELNQQLFDESSAKGLMQYNISMTDGLMLAFESETIETKNIIKDINIEDYMDMLIKLPKLSLCPELSELREVLIKNGYYNDDPQFENAMKNEQQEFEWKDDGQFFDNNMNEQQVYDDDFSVNSNQLENMPIQSKLLHEEREQIRQPHFFNLQIFEQITSRIGTGKVFENEKDQVSWLKLNTKFQTRCYLMKQTDDRPRKKKQYNLPFNFHFDNEELDREAILQPGVQQNYILTKEQLSQQNLLPKEYFIDRLTFDSPYQLVGFPKFNKDLNNEFLYQNDINEEINIEDQPGELEGQQQLKSYLSSELKANQHYSLNIPIKQLKAQVWDAIESQIPEFTNDEEKEGLKFLDIHKRLPQILGIPTQKGNVSMQTAFVTILHLANDKDLRLVQNNDENNFLIYKEANN